MPKFTIGPKLDISSAVTARLGSAANDAGRYTDADIGKFVKLAGESRYALCAAGDPIEGVIEAVEPATQDGYSIGTVVKNARILAICDGSEAAGTGSMAVGEYVVCGTIVAAKTALTSTTGPKVRTATNQPGAVIDVTATVNQTTVNAALAALNDQGMNALYAWRVVSLIGDGSVGTTCIIERVSPVN